MELTPFYRYEITQDHHTVDFETGICACDHTGMVVHVGIMEGLELESLPTFAFMHALLSTTNQALILRLTCSARLMWTTQFNIWDSRKVGDPGSERDLMVLWTRPLNL